MGHPGSWLARDSHSIHSFIYLLGAYHMAGTVLSPRNATVNQTDNLHPQLTAWDREGRGDPYQQIKILNK